MCNNDGAAFVFHATKIRQTRHSALTDVGRKVTKKGQIRKFALLILFLLGFLYEITPSCTILLLFVEFAGFHTIFLHEAFREIGGIREAHPVHCLLHGATALAQ